MYSQMEVAPLQKSFTFAGFKTVKAGIVQWPMSVIRLTSDSKEDLTELADKNLTGLASILRSKCTGLGRK